MEVINSEKPLKPSSERKLLEWRQNAIRKGLNPDDIGLFINYEKFTDDNHSAA